MADRPQFALIANPENRRCQFFLQAAANLGLPTPKIVSWESLLEEGQGKLVAALQDASALRIESPGENAQVERQLLLKGLGDIETEPQFARFSRQELLDREEDRGRIRGSRQWWHGWSRALEGIEAALAEAPHCRVMNGAASLRLLFDKLASQERMEQAGVPVPNRYGIPRDWEDLLERLEGQSRRVFIKPCHSSSASGVVALALAPNGDVRATAPIEMVGEGSERRLYNSLRVRTYTELQDVRHLINALCQERVLAEQWFPKAGLAGRVFDLRMLVVAGKVSHTVVRQSRGPITNLHLGNERGDLALVIARLGPDKWEQAQDIACQAAACFPDCHYVAIDLMVHSNFSQFAIAEANAFGDLLPRIEHQGMDTYTWELATWCGRGASD